MPTWRICLTIESFLVGDQLLYSLFIIVQRWYGKEKLDASHSKGFKVKVCVSRKAKNLQFTGFKFCIFTGLENNKKLDLVSRNNPFSPSIMSVLSRKRLKCWMLFPSGIFICLIAVLLWKYIDIMKKNSSMVAPKSERVKRTVNKYLSWTLIGYSRINIAFTLVSLKKLNRKAFSAAISG